MQQKDITFTKKVKKEKDLHFVEICVETVNEATKTGKVFTFLKKFSTKLLTFPQENAVEKMGKTQNPFEKRLRNA